MQIQLSQKERMFLEDGKIQEEICVEKYKKYSQQTQDPQLNQLFNKLSGEEQHHLNIINELLQGKEPNLSHANLTQQPSSQSTPKAAANIQQDKMLCSDLLSTEKYVSGTYDIDIFESANPVVRQAMQHIQEDEQKHGEELFNYMNSHGMYDVK
ncbi:Spore coat protein CotF [Clostridium acidisoli DSM 12555]|jgi:spore coat protein CotF|uniref:Spore coat protein CotF n=1 Tax=Clostridium acidisoli DSM 12555 TaxID=1121291 RepID=A0A1W1WYV2_9CLOT|nr:spore coat protein [Clostridium acidisoli]SMC16814.1 Spore coat protein CotF [Clostridium acidisoli DSM 12555]